MTVEKQERTGQRPNGQQRPNGFGPRKPQPKPVPKNKANNADLDFLRAEIDAFASVRSGEVEVRLVGNMRLIGRLQRLGQYTYTLDAKDAKGKYKRLLVQKHAVLFALIGETPTEEHPTQPRKTVVGPRNPKALEGLDVHAEALAYQTFQEQGKHFFTHVLLTGDKISGKLARIGQYTYTVDRKEENSDRYQRLVLQKHAIAYSILGDTPEADIPVNR